MSYLYLIRLGATDVYKIGITTNLVRRIRSLQTGASQRLICLGAWQGGRREERRIHAELARYRVHGEWFEASIEMVLAACARHLCVECDTALPGSIALPREAPQPVLGGTLRVLRVVEHVPEAMLRH